MSVEDTTVESGRPAGRTTCRSVDAVPPAFDDFGATSALAVCDASTGQEPAISDALAVVAPVVLSDNETVTFWTPRSGHRCAGDSREACNEQRRAIVGGCSSAVVMIFIVMVIAAMT